MGSKFVELFLSIEVHRVPRRTRRGSEERPGAPLVLTETEREGLVALTLRRKTARALAQRARIVLACPDGLDNKVVAVRRRVTPRMIDQQRASTSSTGSSVCLTPRSTTLARSRLYGQRLPKTSLPASRSFVCELRTHDTSDGLQCSSDSGR